MDIKTEKIGKKTAETANMLEHIATILPIEYAGKFIELMDSITFHGLLRIPERKKILEIIFYRIRGKTE